MCALAGQHTCCTWITGAGLHFKVNGALCRQQCQWGLRLSSSFILLSPQVKQQEQEQKEREEPQPLLLSRCRLLFISQYTL